MRSRVEQTAETIETQARRLGYTVETDQAATGTIYLEVEHPVLCDCDGECVADHSRLVRVADHDPNEARYAARVNREPSLFVEPGFQAAAVRILAEWIAVDPDTIPYVRRAATLQAKAEAAAEARREAIDAERRAMLDDCRRRYESASAEDRAKASHYETLHGKSRKYYRSRHGKALRRAGAMA